MTFRDKYMPEDRAFIYRPELNLWSKAWKYVRPQHIPYYLSRFGRIKWGYGSIAVKILNDNWNKTFWTEEDAIDERFNKE